jgi:uncharacterized protein YutE (UPF0331/DUF86 family)
VVLKREVVEARLKELSRVLAELGRYREVTVDELQSDLSRRWIVERGLIAAAGLIPDAADHVLVGHFGSYSDTYEGSLRGLREHQVVPDELYQRLRGFGGLRNLLVHRYQEIDPALLHQHLHRALEVLPRFGAAVLEWLETA